MHLNHQSRCGFTLIETLVVVVIIGVLASLIIPAVQSARESSRRSLCVNHIKQLAFGALTFETVYGRVPGGTPFRASFGTLPIRPKHYHGQGWIVEVLPFIELESLYDRFAEFRESDYIGPYLEQPPKLLELVKVQPEEFVCPSDPTGRELITNQFQWEGIPVAPTNYRGVMGSNQMLVGSNTFPIEFPLQQVCNDGRARCNGMICAQQAHYPVRLKNVTDGLSRTMMVGEDLPSHNHHTMWSFSNGDSSSTCPSLNFSLNRPDPKAWWDMRGFRSLHPGGVNFAFADGSVIFVNEDINFQLYRAMSTISQRDTD